MDMTVAVWMVRCIDVREVINMTRHTDDYALKQIVDELLTNDKYRLTWEYNYPILTIDIGRKDE
jgi:hypothetical protein